MSYVFQKGDYIAFTRVIYTKKESKPVRDPATGRTVLTPSIPEQVLSQGGEGLIVSISKEPKNVVTGKDRDGHPVKTKFRTARVAAGTGLGTVTAVLDDAVLTAKQGGLFEMAPVDTDRHDMYGTDLRLS